MAYTFGAASLERRKTIHPKLQEIVDEAIKHVNFSIVYGHRDKDSQDEAFERGVSKLQWPDSKHNSLPSKAVDVAPYPIDWDNTNRFCYLAGIIMMIAKQKGIRLRWGGDWNEDGELKNNRFNDLPHFELID